MANVKEIKNRINSVHDTQKITKAMYLIATTKMRRAKSALDKTRPHFDALQGEIKRIFRTAEKVESKYFYPEDGSATLDGTYGCLVITADKGLAGAYNQNVIKGTLKLLEQHKDTKLFVVGEYGRQFFMKHNIPIEQDFHYTDQNPTLYSARKICSHLLKSYNSNALDKIFIIYTDFQNGLSEEAKLFRLLPFHRGEFFAPGEKKVTGGFEFKPSVTAVLDVVMPSYVTGFIYDALVDSFCSEQHARMTAMHSANDNAEKILARLSMQYNQVRQALITREITEISAGAKAQRYK